MHKREASLSLRSKESVSGASSSKESSRGRRSNALKPDEVKVPRSKGCRNCVIRHIKCDQTRPNCVRCQKAKRNCPGYETTKFVDETSSIENLYYVSGAKPSPPSVSPSTPSERRIVAGAFTTRPDANDVDPTQAIDWPQALLERRALITLLCPSAYQAQLFSDFIISTRGPQAAPTFHCHSRWLSELALRDQQSTALVWAIRAIGTSNLGRQAQDQTLIQTSRKVYGKALLILNLALQHQDESLSPDTLSATILLSFYEIFNCTGPDSWIQHAGGAGKLIRLRGPSSYRTGFERAVFMACRYSLIMESFHRREPCFLAQPAWRQLCQEIHESSPNRGPVTSETEGFLQEIVAYPAYLQKALHVMTTADADVVAAESALDEGSLFRTSLQQSHARMVAALEAADLTPIKRESSTQDIRFPMVYDYPHIQIASLYCGFWSVSIALNIAIVALKVRLDRLLRNDEQLFQSPAGPSPWLSHTWANSEQQVLLQMKGPNEVTRPFWNAARNTEAQYHPHLVENLVYAREICKSAEYMSNAPFLGPLFLIIALQVALNVLEGPDEKLWIIGRLDSLGHTMALARRAFNISSGHQQGQRQQTMKRINPQWQENQTPEDLANEYDRRSSTSPELYAATP